MPESGYSKLFEQFPFGTVAHAHYAVERPELEELRHYAVKGSRVLLEGPRRIGKTLLVKSAIAEDRLLIVDLKELTSEENVVNGMRRAIEQFTGKELAKTRTTDRTSESKLSFTLGYLRGQSEARSDQTDLEQLFGEIERIAQERVPLIVFFDEIQTLMEFEGGLQIAERLRALSQHQHQVSYFFAGSNSYLLKKLTAGAKTPFYKQLSRVILQPIDRDVFGKWIQQRLKDHDAGITEEALEFVFRFARDIPGDVQRVLAEAYATVKARSCSEPLIDLDVLDFSILRTLSADEPSLDTIVRDLSRNKHMLLLTIAAMLHTDQNHPITGQVVRQAAGISSPGTIDSTRGSLAQDGLISQWHDRYQINDPFPEAYLIKQYRLDYDRIVLRLNE
ncbi:MAG: AAA family ATPase [Roseibacillus sp.]